VAVDLGVRSAPLLWHAEDWFGPEGRRRAEWRRPIRGLGTRLRPACGSAVRSRSVVDSRPPRLEFDNPVGGGDGSPLVTGRADGLPRFPLLVVSGLVRETEIQGAAVNTVSALRISYPCTCQYFTFGASTRGPRSPSQKHPFGKSSEKRFTQSHPRLVTARRRDEHARRAATAPATPARRSACSASSAVPGSSTPRPSHRARPAPRPSARTPACRPAGRARP
jgi:hypothetical protein